MRKINLVTRIGTAVSAGALAAGMLCGPVLAASNDVIDMNQTVGWTIYKYDLTAATKAGIDVSKFETTGERNEAAETQLANYAIQGVEFSYYYAGDVATYSSGGHTQLAYVPDAAMSTMLGMQEKDAVTVQSGKAGYAPDDLAKALSGVVSDEVAGKNKIEQWCAANKATAMAETDANGMTTVSGLKPGLYFVTETKTPQNIFSTTLPFFVPAPMTDVTGDRWMPHISLYPKNESDECELDKLVSEHGVFEDGTTASEGDVLDYRIVTKVSKITSGVTHFTKFDIRDRMGNGLTYNKDVTISIYDSENDARNGTGTPAATWTPAMFNVTYENTSSGSSMTIVPTADGFKELNSKCSEKYLVASYSVTVNSNDNTVLGDSGNDNDVTLTYSRSNTAYSETLEDKARVTTYGIDLKKTFSDGKGDASKVQFVLRNTTDNYFLTATGSNGVYYVTGQAKEESGATAFSPAANGTLQINGMEADTYEMTEIKTDSGYTLLAQPMTIQITATDTTIVPSTANVTGFGKTQAQVGVTLNHSASATVDSTDTRMLADDESNNARVEMAVNNTRNLLVDLPKTGGIGTVMFTVLGVCGTAAGAVVLAKSKRNDKKAA